MADSRQHLDFDEWRVLASRDPDEFEAARRKALDAVIARAPERRRQRLRGLQWRVDQVRGRSSSPMAACISLTDMMWESFAGENGLMDALHGQHALPRKPVKAKRSMVIPMPKDRGKPS